MKSSKPPFFDDSQDIHESETCTNAGPLRGAGTMFFGQPIFRYVQPNPIHKQFITWTRLKVKGF
jgi:hypothetical protein